MDRSLIVKGRMVRDKTFSFFPTHLKKKDSILKYLRYEKNKGKIRRAKRIFPLK